MNKGRLYNNWSAGGNAVTICRCYICLGRSRAAYPLCRRRAINIITQFSKCQLTKTFCYTQNSL